MADMPPGGSPRMWRKQESEGETKASEEQTDSVSSGGAASGQLSWGQSGRAPLAERAARRRERLCGI